MALLEMADWRETRKASLVAVLKPMGRERLMWSGRGEPRSLVRWDSMLILSLYKGRWRSE